MAVRRTRGSDPVRAAERERFVAYLPKHDDASDALLAQVIASPADLSVRERYADALSALGDVRGEYIKLALKDAPTVAEQQRRDDLFARYGPEWRRLLVANDPKIKVALRGGLSFAGGFIEHAAVQIRTGEVVDYLRERVPLRALAISSYEAAEGWVERLARHPVLAQLRALDVGSSSSSSPLTPLFESGSLANLESLAISCDINVEVAAAIARGCPRLQKLTLRHNGPSYPSPLASEVLEVIATLPLVDELVVEAVIDERAARAIAAMSRLKSLELSWGGESILPPGLTSLACSLDSLAIRRVASGADLQGVLEQPALAQLRRLSLTNCGLIGDALGEALRALRTRALVELEVSHNPLGVSGARAIVNEASLANLEVLRVSQCGFGGAAFADLAGGSWPLVEADLGLNEIDDDGATALARGPFARTLKRLGLSMTKIPSSAAKRLAEAPWLETLESLYLFSNKMGTTGLRAILAKMPNARELTLCRENNFKQEAILAVTRGWFPKLVAFRADDAEADNIVACVESGALDNATSVHLGHATISLAAAEALASLPRVGTGIASWSQYDAGAEALLKQRWPFGST